MEKKNERKKEREITFCLWKMRERERDHFVCEKISKYIVREGIIKAKK